MSSLAAATRSQATTSEQLVAVGPLGRLGGWTADHVRGVSIAWVIVAVALAAFAPKVETALSGAGWQANGSESVQARTLIQAQLRRPLELGIDGRRPLARETATSPAFRQTVARVERILRADPHVSRVQAPQRQASISADGHTALVIAGAKGDPTQMVAAADTLKSKLHAAGAAGVSVSLTGASGMWSDFNSANRSAMMKSELFSWPVTMAILVLAFGSLVAAGLPLLLTIVGLVASAGLLTLLTHGFEISIWAMNFALMFALALGIDYALFIVHRFRGAFFGSKLDVRDAVAVTMDTAGKAVLFSGLTVLVSLSAVMLVPSPAFRSMALGIMLSVVFVLAATLTLLPAVLAKLGPKVDALPLSLGALGRASLARASPAGASGSGAARTSTGPRRRSLLVLLALPIFGLKTGMPSIKVVPKTDAPASATPRCSRPSAPARPARCRSSRPRARRPPSPRPHAHDRGIARVSRRSAGGGGLALVQAIPTADPSSKAVGATIDRLRATLPAGALVGGAAAENHDLERALAQKTPLVIGVVLALGFLLLLVALQAPLIAALGVVTNLLATGAAFGIGRLIFQNGHGAGLLGFESQGFMDAWAPGLLLRDDLRDLDGLHRVPALLGEGALGPLARSARGAVGGLAHSGRVIFAAAAVMVAVFFTFALSGPLPPKEMGVILGIAVLLDAMLVRLVLIPTLLRVFGRHAWALPRWLDRLLPDVRFGHS